MLSFIYEDQALFDSIFMVLRQMQRLCCLCFFHRLKCQVLGWITGNNPSVPIISCYAEWSQEAAIQPLKQINMLLVSWSRNLQTSKFFVYFSICENVSEIFLGGLPWKRNIIDSTVKTSLIMTEELGTAWPLCLRVFLV